MKRQFVAGAMGLALAGCAHLRGDDPKGPNPANPVGPVGMKPVPSLHDTINRGTGGAALARTALGDPKDPRWSGHAAGTDADRPGTAGAPIPSQAAQPPQAAAIDPTATGPPVPITAAQPPQAAARAAGPIRPRWSDSPPSLAGDAPDRLAEQPNEARDPRSQPAGMPDRLNPTPSLDVAAAAAAAG